MDFEELKHDYQMPNRICGRLGTYYDSEYDQPLSQRCVKWNCSICRPYMRNKLYFNLLQAVYNYDFKIHFMITFPGNNLRKYVNYEGSYRYMNHRWKNFWRSIIYVPADKKHGLKPYYRNIEYIVLPRSQNNPRNGNKPGYCHYHVFLNKGIDIDYIKERSLEHGFGWSSIKRNYELAEYLSKDFWYDPEWVIPYNIRHYRCSRGIYLSKDLSPNLHMKFFGKDAAAEVIRDWVWDNYGYTNYVQYLDLLLKGLDYFDNVIND